MNSDVIFENIKLIENEFPLPETEALVNFGVSIYKNELGEINTGALYPSNGASYPLFINAINAVLQCQIQNYFTGPVGVFPRFNIKLLGKKHFVIWERGDIELEQTHDMYKCTVNVGQAELIKGEISAESPVDGFLPGIHAKPSQFSITLKRSENAVGIGTFLIPIFPTAIIYCPPQGEKGKNYVSYTKGQTYSTSIGSSFQTDESTTKPTSPTYYSAIHDVKPCIETIKKIGSKIPGIGKTLGTACDILLSGMGSASATDETGVNKVENEKVIIDNSDISISQTPDNGEPGLDDIICIRKNVRIGWWSYNNNMRLIFLGSKTSSKISVRSLLEDLQELHQQPEASIPSKPSEPYSDTELEFPNNPENYRRISRHTLDMLRRIKLLSSTAHITENLHTNIDDESASRPLNIPHTTGRNTGFTEKEILALLSLDPFVIGGPSVELEDTRFSLAKIEDADQIEFIGNQKYTYQIKYELSMNDMSSILEYKTHIEEYKSGFLSFLGWGVEEDKKTVSTTRYTACRESIIGNSITSSLYIDNSENDKIALRAYYDKAFGTFAFQEVPIEEQAWYSDTAIDENGNPISNTNVVLSIGGKKLLTRTDEKGKFSFHSSNFQKGMGLVKAGAFSKSINFNNN